MASNGGTGLRLIPVDHMTAKRFVNEHHRHNEAPVGMRFCVGLENAEGELVGVAIVARPSSRKLQEQEPYLCEITRVATIGQKNANSMLYGAACRMAKAGGYRSIITYTLESESGASLKASGFEVDAEVPASASWWRPSRPTYDETLFGPRKIPTGENKLRWRRELVRSGVVAA